MSCHGCGSEFGMFKKELGCECCRFSFCGRCCSKKKIEAEDSSVKQLICNKCYDGLTSGKSSASYSPPIAFKKRMTALEDSFNLYSGSQIKGAYSGEQNEKDKEIAERLQKLKRERNKELLPSQSEIEERLAKLKGMDPSKYTAPPIMVYRPLDRRSSVEQTSDLIKQITDEVRIDSNLPRPEDEIAARLARLKGYDVPSEESQTKEIEEKILFNISKEVHQAKPHGGLSLDEINKLMHEESQELEATSRKEINDLDKSINYKSLLENLQKKENKEKDEDNSEDEEEEANMIIDKLLSVKTENEMESMENHDATKVQSPERSSEENDENAPEEFPWCVICTEDAKMRCFGCDGDLYCIRCFRECHDSLDIKDHKTCPFLFPKM